MGFLSEKRFKEILTKIEEIRPILVLGDVAVDKYTCGEVSRISPEAPVPVIKVTDEWSKLGMAANIADNLKSLNIESTLCSVIGDDKQGSQLEHLLEESGLKIWGLVRDDARQTTYKERVTTKEQQVCRIDYEQNDRLHTETENKIYSRLQDFCEEHSSLIIEDYAKGCLGESLLNKTIRLMQENKKLVCVDPGRGVPPLYYQGADLLKPNYNEAVSMVEMLGYTQVKDVEELGKILLDKLKLKSVVITLGAKGMALLEAEGHAGGKLHIIPTLAKEVFDVSGAGDTVVAVLTACLVAGTTLEEAAWMSNCAAGVVVAKRGTATVNSNELAQFYLEFAGKVS